MRSTWVRPKRPAPTPSWKTSTRIPYAARTESRLTAIAVSGIAIDRNASVSKTAHIVRTNAITIGSHISLTAKESRASAGAPPTKTRSAAAPNAAGT